MPETLFLTMNVIDRFLEEKAMTRKNLQLVSSYPIQSVTSSTTQTLLKHLHVA